MSDPKRGRLIRLVRQPDLARDVASFVVDRQARGLSPRTVEFYADELRYLCSWLESVDVAETRRITPTHLRRYLLHLSERRNPGGLHAAYRAMRAFFNWYGREYELQDWRNPVARVDPPRLPRKQLDPLPLPDLRAMLATCQRRTFAGDRDRAILLCLLDTGCRAAEFLALDVADVNLQSGAVLVQRGKGGKWRTVFLGARSRRELARYLRHVLDDGPLWRTVTGARLQYEGLRKIVVRRAERAGVPAPSLHSFRRAFALLCLRDGMDVYSLQKLMGHSDLSVLQRYLKQNEDDLRAAHQAHSPTDKLL